MTENEAIEKLECMRLFMKIEDERNESKFLEDDYIANKMAIQALSEIQQYKAVGTIDEFKALKEKSVAKKVNIQQWIYTECECGYEFSKHHGDGYYSIPYEKQTNYCPNCGQKLDWQ